MITRRHIRLKVMQSLYSYFTSLNPESLDLEDSKSLMMRNIQEIHKLHIFLLFVVLEIHNYCEKFLDESKKKNIPSEDDLNPNTKFLDNRIIQKFKSDDRLKKEIDACFGVWRAENLNIIKGLFLDINKNSKVYRTYLTNNKDSFDDDKLFICSLLEYILENEILIHSINQESIFFDDDLPFVFVFLKNQINFLDEKSSDMFFRSVFKDEDDENFAVFLFERTIFLSDDLDDLIRKNLKNWEFQRIAIMDKILIKMSIAEMMSFESIPIKVSFNEYLEISKYYSTSKSKIFINGILDKIVSQLMNDDKIHKNARGLI